VASVFTVTAAMSASGTTVRVTDTPGLARFLPFASSSCTVTSFSGVPAMASFGCLTNSSMIAGLAEHLQAVRSQRAGQGRGGQRQVGVAADPPQKRDLSVAIVDAGLLGVARRTRFRLFVPGSRAVRRINQEILYSLT